MWSSEPYALTGIYETDEGGSPVLKGDGTAKPKTVRNPRKARMMRSLDAFDPLGGRLTQTITELQTVEEMLFYLDDYHWCEHLNLGVVPARRDMYRTITVSELKREIETFLETRVTWAENAVRKADSDEGSKRAKEYLAYAKRQNKYPNVNHIAGLLKCHNVIDPSRLDQGDTLLGTPLGVFNLDSGTLVADEDEFDDLHGIAQLEDYTAARFMVTKSINATPISDMLGVDHDYDPRWDEFVDQITDGDIAKAKFLQRGLGYSLFGGNPEKAFFILWGQNRDNGKSTLMNIVKTVMGEYAGTADVNLLLTNRNTDCDKPTPTLAGLVGKRLVDVSEPPLGRTLNGAMVKKLASGTDEIAVRHLHAETFAYVPRFTLWMHCNNLPRVEDPTAIDPYHTFVVEFTRSFKGKDKDPGLFERFTGNDNGKYTVLMWLYEGYRLYRAEGLNPPPNVRATIDNWLTLSRSWVDWFLSEACVLDSSARVPVGEFKDAAKAFCESVGEEFRLRDFKRALADATIVDRKGAKGVRFYYGVALKDGFKLPPETSEIAKIATPSDVKTAKKFKIM